MSAEASNRAATSATDRELLRGPATHCRKKTKRAAWRCPAFTSSSESSHLTHVVYRKEAFLPWMVREEADERTVLGYAQAFFQRARDTPRPSPRQARERPADETDNTKSMGAAGGCGGFRHHGAHSSTLHMACGHKLSCTANKTNNLGLGVTITGSSSSSSTSKQTCFGRRCQKSRTCRAYGAATPGSSASARSGACSPSPSRRCSRTAPSSGSRCGRLSTWLKIRLAASPPRAALHFRFGREEFVSAPCTGNPATSSSLSSLLFRKQPVPGCTHHQHTYTC